MVEWQELTYAHLFRERRERFGESVREATLLSVSASSGVIQQTQSGRRNTSADDKSNYLVVRAGDVVYNTMRMWQGRSGLARRDGIVSPAYTVLEPKDKVAHGPFLAHLMKLPRNIAAYRSMSQGLVSDTWNLKFSLLSSLLVAIPSPVEQERIAAVLDIIDESIRAAYRVIAKLKLVHAGVTEAVIADVDPGTRVCLKSVADVDGGLALSAKRAVANAVELPYLRVANVQDGFIDTTIMKTVEVDAGEASRYELRRGDMLMNEGGDFDKLGRGAVWDGRISPCLHQNHVFRVRCDTKRLLPEFLSLFCRSVEGRSYFVNNSKQTTNLASINKSQIGAFPILVPSLAAQSRAVGAVVAVNGLIEAEAVRSKKLRVTRAGLADDLLTGRVRVPA